MPLPRISIPNREAGFTQHHFFAKSGAGFTLIEIVVVMALMTIVFSLALVVSPDIFRGRSFSSERDTVVSILQKARNESMNNIDSKAHGVYFGSTDYVLFQGSSYATRDTSFDTVITAAGSITHSGSSEVDFGQLDGKPGSAGNVTLTDGTALHTAIVSWNSEGQIDW